MLLASFGLLSVYSYTRADGRTHVSAAVPARLNFQARLLQSNGAIVADGNYSVEFNLYIASSGGSSAWSETHGTVAVRAGYLNVYLGDVNNDLDTLDWSQQHWLTMNVNGDGEMSPRLRLTSVPYAFRTSQADGITSGAGILEADDIAQLAPSSVQAVNTALAALRINQQGAGLLAQLQGAGSDVFTIANNGDVVSAGDATFSGGTLNLGAATQAGGLVLSDGSSHTGTIQTAALGQNTTYTLPDPGSASATICLSSGNCSGGGDILNGGNSTGATLVIGTNDAQVLGLETGGTTKLTIDTAGNLDLVNGGLEIGGTAVVTNGRLLQNLTGISTTGGLVFNSFSGNAGMLQVDASGNVSLATAGTTYEVPLTFGNGLTRSSNTVSLGGSLSANTEIALGTNSLSFTGTGNIGIGTNSPTSGVLEVVRNANVVLPSVRMTNTNGGTNAYAFNFMASDSAGGLFGVGPGTAGIANLSDATFAASDSTASGGLVLSARATSAGGIKFYTNGNEVNERMRIDSSGNVNIGGDATPDSLFTVGSASAFQVNNSGNLLAVGINNSSGGITNAGNITGLGANVTATAGLTIASGGSSALTLDSASNALVLAASDTSILRTASGNFTFDLTDSALTKLVLNNGGSGAMNLNLQDGGLEVAGTVVLTNARVLQNVTFDTGLITSGTLGVARGGTGLNTLTTNGILYASGTSAVSQANGTAGQILLANASNIPTFTTLSGDITINSTGVTTIGANSVALASDTTGNYVSTVTVGNGLAVSGVGSEDATANITITLPTSGTTSTTSSNSGLELTTAGLSLFRGCSNAQVMEWNGGTGAWNCATDNTGLSDSTIKTNVTSVGSVLDNIKNLNIVDFNFKCNDGLWASYRFTCDDQTGILAQDLALTFPELVSLRPDGLNQVDFGRLNFYTLKAVTELANFVEADGDAKLTNIYTNNTLRLSSTGSLQNINGLTIVSGGASVTGGIDNNSGGITETGAIGGATTINASGLATLSGGASVSGGSINLNVGGLLANTSINTGISTGTVSIGGGLAALVIDSTNFDVSSAGALSGITTLNASGVINGVGGFAVNGSTGQTINCGSQNVRGGFTGGIATSVTCGGLSDVRLKENITSLDSNTLSKLSQINTVNFDFRCHEEQYADLHLDCERQTGVIAQELAQVLPELVYQGEDGYYRVKYDALNIYTLKSVQELNEKVGNQVDGELEQVKTAGTLRLSNDGELQNITGFNMISGGASVIGGLNNNGGGLTNAGAILGATTIEGQSLTLNAEGTGDILALKKDGNGVFTIFNTGALEMKLDSENAFAVKTSGGSTYFNVNTIRALVSIGSIVPDEKAVLFTLDAKESIDDPEGVNGASYFNSKLQRFRCYQDDRWTDCLPVGTLNDPITLDRTAWGSQPSADTEFPGTPRILPNYSMAHEFRLRMRVTTPGNVGASCRLQFAQTDDGPWADLADGASGELKIDASGTLATDWLKIKEEARDEVVVRIMCKGGNGVASPSFYGVSVQLR